MLCRYCLSEILEGHPITPRATLQSIQNNASARDLKINLLVFICDTVQNDCLSRESEDNNGKQGRRVLR